MNRKSFFFCLLLIGMLSSCKEKEELPADVLPKDKMTAILTDIQLAEAAIQSKGLERNDSTKAIAYGYYGSIYKKHNVSPEQFRKSFDYYAHHLDVLSKMYDDVITDLNKREATGAN